MKKGFTIVELLAVVVILASIMLIIIPLVVNSVKNSEDTMTSQTKDNIVLAAKHWANDNKEKLPTNNDDSIDGSIYVETLKDEGYLDSEIKDEFKDSCVIISNKNDVYYYKYEDDSALCSSKSLYRTLYYNASANGGDESGNISKRFYHGTKVKLDVQATKDGYEFIGWNNVQEAQTGLDSYIMPNEDTTLYAIYRRRETYTLVTNKNSGTGTAETVSCKTQYIYNNEEQELSCVAVLPNNSFTRDGYTFNGFSANEEDTRGLNPGTEVTLTKNQTYYAIWKLAAPTCNLTLTGTLGSNGWYISDVEVKMTTTGVLDSYGLATSEKETNSKKTITHTTDGNNITYYGYVKNTTGENSCSITFKRDATPPTFISVDNSSGGNQTSDPVVISAKATDTMSGMDRIIYKYSTSDSEHNDWDNINTASEVKGTWKSERNNEVLLYAFDKAGNSTKKSAGKVYIVKDSDFKLYSELYCNTGACNVPGTSYWNDKVWKWWWSGANSGIDYDSFYLNYSTEYVTNYCFWNNSNCPYGSRSNCGYVQFNSDSIYFSRSYANASIVVHLCTNTGVCREDKRTF